MPVSWQTRFFSSSATVTLRRMVWRTRCPVTEVSRPAASASASRRSCGMSFSAQTYRCAAASATAPSSSVATTLIAPPPSPRAARAPRARRRRRHGRARRAGSRAGPSRVHLREVREDRADDVEVAERRRREQVEPRAVLDEEERDLAAAHVRSRSQARLPVAAAPVPGGVDQLRFLLQERGDGVDVAVRLRHELLHQLRIELRRRVAHAPRLLSAAALPARRPKTTHSSSEFPIMRFLPWVPPAISPHAKTPSSVVSACSSITSPPFW